MSVVRARSGEGRAPAAAQANGHAARSRAGGTGRERPPAGVRHASSAATVRVRVDGRAHIRSGQTTISAGLVDLSEGGVRCVLPEDAALVTPGATLGGPFLLEAETTASRICLDVTGRISWRRSAGAGTHFGVAFGELADGETEGVHRFLAAASGKGRVDEPVVLR